MTYTPGQLIETYLKLRNTVSVMEAEFDAQVKEYKNAMDTCENTIQQMMLEQGVTQFKAEAGTAYQSTTMRVSMENRDAIVNAIVTGDLTFDIFTNAVSKDYVKKIIDETGAPPAGVGVAQITKVNFRKA